GLLLRSPALITLEGPGLFRHRRGVAHPLELAPERLGLLLRARAVRVEGPGPGLQLGQRRRQPRELLAGGGQCRVGLLGILRRATRALPQRRGLSLYVLEQGRTGVQLGLGGLERTAGLLALLREPRELRLQLTALGLGLRE